MPREVQTTVYTRAHRHFCPLVFNTLFLREGLLICPPLTFTRVFIREAPRSPSVQPTLGSSRPQKIPKPPGEVTRLKRGGYTLEDKLYVSHELYKTIQVCTYLFSPYFTVSNLHRLERCTEYCAGRSGANQAFQSSN